MMDTKRLYNHKKNENLEGLLQEVNGLLGPVESREIASFEKSRYPLVLIVGCARSGSTLMLQWLAGTGCFCYPTNILSRFFGAPYIGAKIQLMLTRFDFKNEIFDFQEEKPFFSNLGKTRGALAPNEFWYFWRRFFHYGEIQHLTEQELKSVDRKQFISELAAIESVFDKPLAMKGMIANWNISFLSNILERVLFVHMQRDPFYNIQSLLEGRLNFYGDIKSWYSFKPPEYTELKKLNPFEQVAGQVYHTNRAIEEGLGAVDESRRLEISYEQFCENPEEVFHRIMDKLAMQGYALDRTYTGPKKFENTNKNKLPEDNCEKIRAAWKAITGKEMSEHE